MLTGVNTDTWGFADVTAAAESISEWIVQNSWLGVGVNATAWIIAGHSNGGGSAHLS